MKIEKNSELKIYTNYQIKLYWKVQKKISDRERSKNNKFFSNLNKYTKIVIK